MVVVRARRADEGDVDEVGIDPRDRRELPVGRVVEEVAQRQEAAAVEIGEVAEVAEQVVTVA